MEGAAVATVCRAVSGPVLGEIAMPVRGNTRRGGASCFSPRGTIGGMSRRLIVCACSALVHSIVNFGESEACFCACAVEKLTAWATAMARKPNTGLSLSKENLIRKPHVSKFVVSKPTNKHTKKPRLAKN